MNLKDVKFGKPEAFNVMVEIPQGSNQKFEYDEASGEMKLNFVFENLVFPFHYGFIIGTMCGDGDPLDAIVLSSPHFSEVIKSGSMLPCQAIGMLKTIDRGEVDDKIVCIPLGDELLKQYKDIIDLAPDTLSKWTKFYLEVARQKKKVIEIIGLRSKEEALKVIRNSHTL